LQNKKVIYDLLFRTSAETLLEGARDPKHLGAEIGFFSVLHTWSQKLDIHPHVHCVVPAGGLSLDHTYWVRSQKKFFLPKPVLLMRAPDTSLGLLARFTKLAATCRVSARNWLKRLSLSVSRTDSGESAINFANHLESVLGFEEAMHCFKRQRLRAVPQGKVLGPELRRAFLDMSRLARDCHIVHPQETFRSLRGHSHDFQAVKFRRIQIRQDLLDCPAEYLLLVNTKDGRSDLTSQAKGGPSRFSDFSIQCTPIEIFD
jgi:hypothetical protein